jgi:Ca2+-binding RTX toxin-like protein
MKVDNMNGSATLSVNLSDNDIQKSNFGPNSFKLTNTGDKVITQVDIDVTNALYPDSVFDPFGLAGDTASKGLQIDKDGDTGVVAPSNDSYIGTGGIAGFERLRLTFDPNDNNGFEPGERVNFSVDMDPNSVAGSQKFKLDNGADPGWDVGGVSGAELIGSSFTVTFADGSTATGQLQGAGNNAGSQGLATQDSPNLDVILTVNGVNSGGVSTYGANNLPSVIVKGPAGKTARVVLTKGFIQPVINLFDDPYKSQLDGQLAALAAEAFPANNAVEFQTVDIELTGAEQNISSLFDFSGVSAFDFIKDSDEAFWSVDEDKVPLGIVASVIDPDNDNLPLGAVTSPIYLTYSDKNEVSLATTQSASEPNTNGRFAVQLATEAMTDTVISYSVSGTATPGVDYAALQGTVVIPAGQTTASIDVSVVDDNVNEGAETIVLALNSITSGDSNVILSETRKVSSLILQDNDTDLPPSTGQPKPSSEPCKSRLVGNRKANTLRGSSCDDTLIGKQGNDRLVGLSGDDRLKGNKDRDILKGQAGDDLLIGGQDRDRLIGGNGDDTYRGGKDNDKLIFGEGQDIAIFGKRDGRDIVKRFDVRQDSLEFKGVTARRDIDIQGDRRGTLISYQQTEVLLRGIDVTDLSSRNIIV